MINTYYNIYWNEYGFSQNYFDSQGIFISIIYSAPLLFISFIIVIQCIYEASTLLIILKKNN